jgi:hypothetical protein
MDNWVLAAAAVTAAGALIGCGNDSTAVKAGPVEATLEPGCHHTKYAGDELCIAAPPVGEGFQVHIGPTDYDDPDQVAEFVLAAGVERTDNYYLKTANTDDIYYYRRQYRMRPGSHHMILYAVTSDHADGWNTTSTTAGAPGTGTGVPASGFGDIGRRLGGSQNESKDNPLGETPAEDEGIGMPLAAHTQLSVNLHHNNTTDHDLLREEWVNFWYVDPATVTQQTNEMFAFGVLAIQPNTHPTLNYKATVTQDGRILDMYGHRHAHNVRFSVWRNRGAQRDLVYDGFDWAEPLVLEYSSVTKNATPDDVARKEGGWTGILDLVKDDVVEWECEVNNDTANVLLSTNETINGEMCILVGETLGPTIAGAFQ